MEGAITKQRKESAMSEIDGMRKALKENVSEAEDVKKFWFEIMDSTVEQLEKMEIELSEPSEDSKTNVSHTRSGRSRSMTRTDAGTENVVPDDDVEMSNEGVNRMSTKSMRTRKRDRAVEPSPERVTKVPSNNNNRPSETEYSSSGGSARE